VSNTFGDCYVIKRKTWRLLPKYSSPNSSTEYIVSLIALAFAQRFASTNIDNKGSSNMKIINMKTIALVSLIFSAAVSPSVFSEQIIYDEIEVNGHEGFLTAWDKNGPLDKVIILAAGFDTDNDDHPADFFYDEYQELLDTLGPDGWDFIYFDYVDGSTDIKKNADNLARFIDYLDTQVGGEYHMALVGGSMGGIVARTMFVQEYRDMGVDTFVTVDSPHWGVTLSEWVEDIAEILLDFEAGHQMHNGSSEYYELYGWLRSIENDGAFRASIIDPMNTCAIALSNGEVSSWKTDWTDIAIHNKFYPVASYVAGEGLRSTFMPYHSTVYMDDRSTDSSVRFGYTKYNYVNTHTSYFDTKIPNDREVHGAPEHVIRQAVDFVLKHQP
jgi:pimeloyl-ACP methyl ester carboxylesterase